MISKTRFAPSPSGLLHLGHAYSALFAWERAGREPSNFILRLEDIDIGRCKPEFETAIIEDLNWLGIDWETAPLRQSGRLIHYKKALTILQAQGLLYPCFCTRKDVEREVQAAANAPHGPEGWLYPGTCRHLTESERGQRIAEGQLHAFRLKMKEAQEAAGPLIWIDRNVGDTWMVSSWSQHMDSRQMDESKKRCSTMGAR